MAQSHKLGNWGEEMARSFLEMCGYVCLEQQYRKQSGELDLVVRRADEVVFVEVKTRGPNSLGPPEAWVDAKKISHLKQTARHWISENPQERPCNFRFDVVAVKFLGHDRGMNIRHLAGAI